jgi:hypothetical protein
MRKRLTSLLVAISLIAIVDCHVALGQSTRVPHRRWLAGTWSLLGTTDQSHVQLNYISKLELVGDQIVTFDYADHKVKAFNFLGAPTWELGGQGLQPGTFNSATAFHGDVRGNIWFADPIPRRVTIISAKGALLRTHDNVPFWRLVPRTDGRVWAFIPTDSSPGIFDTTGHSSLHVNVPTELKSLQIPSNDLFLASGPRDSVIIAYYWADRFVVVGADGTNPREFSGITNQKFPTTIRTPRTVGGMAITKVSVDSTANPACLAAVWNGPFLYALQFSPRADSTSAVDIYRVSSGAYVGSRALPERAIALALRGDTVVAIVTSPRPAIRIWRWTPNHPAASR